MKNLPGSPSNDNSNIFDNGRSFLARFDRSQQHILTAQQYENFRDFVLSNSDDYCIEMDAHRRIARLRSWTPQEKLHRHLDWANTQANQVIDQANAMAATIIADANLKAQQTENSSQQQIHAMRISIEKERRESGWRMFSLFMLGMATGAGLLFCYLNANSLLRPEQSASSSLTMLRSYN